MSRPRFVIRTIKNGRAKILHQYFVPDSRFTKYDGRLNGMRYAFGLYWQPCRDRDEWENYMCALWGTEEAYRAIGNTISEEDYDKITDYYWQPEQMPELVDGYFPWYFWMREEEQCQPTMA